MKTSNANAAPAVQHQRQQHQRPAIGIVGGNDEGLGVFTNADFALPGREHAEALIGACKLPLFELAPDCFHLSEVADDIDARDAACPRPCWRCCRPAVDRRRDGHRKTCLRRKKFTLFVVGRPLQRSVNKG